MVRGFFCVGTVSARAWHKGARRSESTLRRTPLKHLLPKRQPGLVDQAARDRSVNDAQDLSLVVGLTPIKVENKKWAKTGLRAKP